MAQLSQGLGFNLTDTLAGYIELLTYLFEGVVGIHVDAEAHSENLGFFWREAAQHFFGRFPEAFID